MDALQNAEGRLQQYTIILHGPPGSGKSSIVKLLTSQQSQPRHRQHKYLHHRYESMPVSTYHLKQFKFVEDDDYVDFIAAEMMKCLQDKSESGLETLDNAIQVLTASFIEDYDQSQVKRVLPSVINRLKKYRKSSDITLFDSPWYKVIESGGQPNFDDYIPYAYSRPALIIVVVNLTEELDTRPKVFINQGGDEEYELPSDLRQTNLDYIIGMCRLARAFGGSFPVHVMVVATHKDQLSKVEGKAKIEKFEKVLHNVQKQFESVLICKSKDEIIFTVETQCQDEKREKYTEELQECITISTKGTSIEPLHVSLNVLVYSMQLCQGDDIVGISECYRIGKNLRMKKSDVENALNLLHNADVVLYFPNEIPGLVAVRTNSILKRLVKLVKASFVVPQYCPRSESEKLHRRGLFNKEFLNWVLHDITSNDLPIDDFLKFLKCLKLQFMLRIVAIVFCRVLYHALDLSKMSRSCSTLPAFLWFLLGEKMYCLMASSSQWLSSF